MAANLHRNPGGLSESDLNQIVEQLAVQVHEAWQRYRLGTGWAYGPVRSDSRRETPNLVTFDQLTEDERNVDRVVARGCVEGLRKLGYELVPVSPDPASLGTEPGLRVIEEQLRIASSLAQLQGLWQQCQGMPGCPPDIHIRVGEEILKRGEPVLAYDVLGTGLSRLERQENRGSDQEKSLQRLMQLSALALAECGAPDRALQVLTDLCARGEESPETLGLLGRVSKDLARNAGSDLATERRLLEAFSQYRRGFDLADAVYRSTRESRSAEDAYYCGINAATVLCLLGRWTEARALAERVREICHDLLANAETANRGENYWLSATLGEAELICGRPDEARTWYRTAVKQATGNWRVLSSIRRQLEALVKAMRQNSADWATLFPKAAVVVFASPAWNPASAAVPEDWARSFHDHLTQRLTDAGVMAGYLCGFSPADLLLGEALLERGAEVHLVLPCGRESCRRFYATDHHWGEKFDQLLAQAACITEDPETYSLPSADVGARFAGLRAYGSSRLRADRLALDLARWGLKDAPWSTGQNGLPFLLDHWNQMSCPWEPLPSGTVLATKDEARAGITSAKLKGEACREVRAMLFADVKGFSKLDEASLYRFVQSFLPNVARALEPFDHRILCRSTAGDGLFLVFADVETAAEVAFKLRDVTLQMPWNSAGLPELAIRISLDAGPVYTFKDAITGEPGVCGTYVNRAARIEPITPPNQVYTSEAFTSLYVASGGQGFRFEYVGQTQLPKGFGLTPLYCARCRQASLEPPAPAPPRS
jgi:class 3 adenylate cyclase